MYFNKYANTSNRRADKNYYFTKHDENKKQNYDILRINHDETRRLEGEYIEDSDDNVDSLKDRRSRAQQEKPRAPPVRVEVFLW